MSKRPDEEAPDMEAGMTTAERRRRRRRGGGLRVPSDNVPRRNPTQPPPVAPVPEDPNLAVSIAYSFATEQSGPQPRGDTSEIPAQDVRADTLTGDGPDVGDIVAPEAQSTAVDVPDEDAASFEVEGAFELKTREMTAVDLEELGLEDPNQDSKDRLARRSGPIVPAAGSSNSIIIDDEDMATSISTAPKKPTTVPMPLGAPGVVPPPSPPPRPAGAKSEPPPFVPKSGEPFGIVAQPGPETRRPEPARVKAPTPAPIAASVPAPVSVKFRAQTPPPAGGFDEDEPSVEIEVDDPSRPGDEAEAVPIARRLEPAAPSRPVAGRAQTVALSDDDLEELMDPDARSGRVKVGNKSGETVALEDNDLEDDDELDDEDLGARAPTPRIDKQLAVATKDESGEIVVDVVEEIDSGDIASPVGRESTPTLRGVAAEKGNGAAAQRPPPPAAATPVTPPPAPAAAKGTDGHTPPPPPAQGKAPPPAPAKKVQAPAGATTAAAVAAAVKAPTADKRAKRGKPWFEEIFDEDYLRTLPFLTPQATQSEAQFVVDALGVAPGAQLLDLGCGYGRHAMELAARGFHLVGLDLSLPLLLRGADEAQRRGLSINFVHADMRELDFDAQFDGVYCLFSTFGFFDDETNKKTASAVARALKPGGRMVIEVLNRDYVIGELPTRVWWEGDGCVVLEEVEFNYFSSRIHSNRSVVFDDGRQIEQEISVRAYSLHELGKLLHAAGFRVVEVSGSVHTRGRYFGNHSRHIIVVAEKKPKDSADGGK